MSLITNYTFSTVSIMTLIAAAVMIITAVIIITNMITRGLNQRRGNLSCSSLTWMFFPNHLDVKLKGHIE